MKKALGELETLREISVGDLIAFMQTYNLRFGPATTGPQVQVYQNVATLLGGVLNDVNPSPSVPPRLPPVSPTRKARVSRTPPRTRSST